MRSQHSRRGRTPLTQAIDQSIDNRKATGQPITTSLVAGDLIHTVSVGLMISLFTRLVTSPVRARLQARGLILVNDQTWDRTTDVNVTNAEFHVTLNVKEHNLFFVTKHVKAARAVAKFLDAQAARLGRPVTMGEFAKQVDAIYATHGVKS